MYVGKEFTFKVLWHFARVNLFRTFLVSTFACAMYIILGWKWVGISFVPIASIGTAVAFYVGFKNNQAYDRLWEARKLWGQITNTGRSFAATFISLVPNKEIQREFVYRHLAWINILRLQLRRTIPWATTKGELHRTFVSEQHELEEFENGVRRIFEEMGVSHFTEMALSRINTANHTIKKQIHELARLKREGVITEFEHSDLLKHLNTLIDCQGGCERIKTTPLFRQYSIFSRVFVNIFIVLLPFGLLNEMNKMGENFVWLTIPFAMLISWVFYTMEQIGEYSENPFDNSINDIPLNTICRNIEIELKEFVGDTDLPQKLNPIDDVLL